MNELMSQGRETINHEQLSGLLYQSAAMWVPFFGDGAAK